MEYVHFNETDAVGKIACWKCGTAIEPNPTNTCVGCLRTEVDITEGIPKQVPIFFCRNCQRYLDPPSHWIACVLESGELLRFLHSRVKSSMKHVKFIDAQFVWTEPHSKRIKLKFTVQKEIQHKAILQQVFIIEFVVHNQMCGDCHRVQAKDFWCASVQVRQKVNHKRSFFYLEQLILKHRTHVTTSNIKEAHDGIDFFFPTKADARKFVDFVLSVISGRYKESKRLISHDVHSNEYNYKYTFSVEIVPICKDDIVCLPKNLARALGNMSQLVVCSRVSKDIHLIDPNTAQFAEINSTVYWRTPFMSVSNSRTLTEFMVINTEFITENERRHIAGQGPLSHKHLLADVWVTKLSNLGDNDMQLHCRSHLGHILNPGDIVLGFDFTSTNVNDHNLDAMKKEDIPNVILVKKVYGDNNSRTRKRKWKLKHLPRDDIIESDSIQGDYNRFLEDLEEDVVLRQNVNIYMDHNKIPVDNDDDDTDFPHITLQEMLDDLNIDEDATGEGAAMME